MLKFDREKVTLKFSLFLEFVLFFSREKNTHKLEAGHGYKVHTNHRRLYLFL